MSKLSWEFVLDFYKNPIIVIILVLGIISFVFYKRIVGWFGERYVKQELNKLSDEYLIINDLMIMVNNKTSQIDHVVISKYGIFVIETKKYNGYIMGNDYDKEWQYIASNKKYYIHNPVHQNYGHVQYLMKALNIEEGKFIPIVSISDTAKLKIKSNKVVSLSNLINKINSYNDIIIDNYKDVYNKLIDLNITDKNIRRKHIKDIKNH